MKKGLFPILGILVAVFTVALGGDTLWTRRYDGPGHSDEMACDVFTDPSRNVIVVGSSPGVTTAYDIVVLKYSPSGDSLWSQRIAGPGASNDVARAAAVDNSGAIYLTATTGTFPDYNILTMKLNPDGSQAWQTTYQGVAGKNDEPAALRVDGNGNVYVTGYETDASDATDYVTIKYNADGSKAWSVNFDGGSNDVAVDLALGPGGSVYVTGSSTQSYTDYATVKYDAGGGQEWVVFFNGSGDAGDVPVAIVVDGAGNAYVTGATATAPPPGGHYNYATLKYGSDGSEVWSKVYTATERGAEPAALILGSSALYITGKAMRTNNFDIATVAYNLETGDTLWTRLFNAPANKNDVGIKICLDPAGKIVVLGNSQDENARNDYYRLRYSPAGALEGFSKFNSSFNNDDQAKGIAIDDAGEVVITGVSFGGIGGMNYDILTVKYDSTAPGVAELQHLPRRQMPLQVQPNPARTRTNLKFNLRAEGEAVITLWDVSGARSRELKIHMPGAGSYPLSLAGLNPGVYLLEVKLPTRTERLKLRVVE